MTLKEKWQEWLEDHPIIDGFLHSTSEFRWALWYYWWRKYFDGENFLRKLINYEYKCVTHKKWNKKDYFSNLVYFQKENNKDYRIEPWYLKEEFKSQEDYQKFINYACKLLVLSGDVHRLENTLAWVNLQYGFKYSPEVIDYRKIVYPKYIFYRWLTGQFSLIDYLKSKRIVDNGQDICFTKGDISSSYYQLHPNYEKNYKYVILTIPRSKLKITSKYVRFGEEKSNIETDGKNRYFVKTLKDKITSIKKSNFTVTNIVTQSQSVIPVYIIQIPMENYEDNMRIHSVYGVYTNKDNY